MANLENELTIHTTLRNRRIRIPKVISNPANVPKRNKQMTEFFAKTSSIISSTFTAEMVEPIDEDEMQVAKLALVDDITGNLGCVSASC